MCQLRATKYRSVIAVPEQRGSGAAIPLCLSFRRYRVDTAEEVPNQQHATRMYDTEESAARETFGQHETPMYDTEESAAIWRPKQSLDEHANLQGCDKKTCRYNAIIVS